MKIRALTSLVFLLAVTSLILGVSAQIGLVAGQPVFNVSAGGTETLNVTLLNSGDTQIGFGAIQPTLNTIPNETTPTVTVSPMSGVIAPHSEFKVSITVSVPFEDKPGLEWTGPAQFLMSSNASNPSGALLRIGAFKILTIYSKKAPFPTDLFFAGIAAAVIIIGSIIYRLASRKKRRSGEAAKKGTARKRMSMKSRFGRRTGRKAKRR